MTGPSALRHADSASCAGPRLARGLPPRCGVWTWRRRPARDPLTSFIDAGAEFEGKCSFSGTLMMNGKLQGDIESTGTIIVGATAILHARISARVVVVHGEIVGDVTGTERVELKPSARVFGDLETPVLVVEERAVLEGRTRMSERGRDVGSPLRLASSSSPATAAGSAVCAWRPAALPPSSRSPSRSSRASAAAGLVRRAPATRHRAPLPVASVPRPADEPRLPIEPVERRLAAIHQEIAGWREAQEALRRTLRVRQTPSRAGRVARRTERGIAAAPSSTGSSPPCGRRCTTCAPSSPT